jgi:hypothetical protein
VDGYSDDWFGDFQGWSLFYCKGLNGEQLKFNVVTRRARLLRARALVVQCGQRHDIGGVVLPAHSQPLRQIRRLYMLFSASREHAPGYRL